MLHVICTQLRPGHLSVRVGDCKKSWIAPLNAIIIIITKGAIRDFSLKVRFEIFHNLLTASQTVSNTYAQVARTQPCANHVQHIGCLSSAICVPRGTKAQLWKLGWQSLNHSHLRFSWNHWPKIFDWMATEDPKWRSVGASGTGTSGQADSVEEVGLDQTHPEKPASSSALTWGALPTLVWKRGKREAYVIPKYALCNGSKDES